MSVTSTKECAPLGSAQVPVIAGFAIMILLLLGVAAIAVSHIRSLGQELTAIVVERNQKSELAASMKDLHEARYRTILLASNLSDPFERDEQRTRFSALAREFIAQRDRFLALPLDAAEQAAWNEVRKELPGVETLAHEAFDLLRAERTDEARRMIQQELKPHQVRMMAQWDALVDIQRDRNAAAVEAAAAASARVRHLLLAGVAAAALVGFAVAAVVIRLSRRMEADLFQERERAVVTLRALGDAVIRFDHLRRLGYMNPAAVSLLGLDEDQIRDGVAVAGTLRLYERESRADLTDTLLDEVLKGMPYVLPPSACLLSAHGMEYEVEGKCSTIRGSDGHIIGGVLVMNDVTEARELQRKLLWHADHDALTGVANRYAFEERLKQSLAGRRVSELTTSLVLIGLDQIKRIRELAGHARSDELLREIARLIGLRVRESDFLARLGEDEFGILLQACPDDMAENIARQIRDSIAGFHLSWEGQSYHADVHVGVVHLDELSHEKCLTAAYAALHEAEHTGPGSIVVHRSDAFDKVA